MDCIHQWLHTSACEHPNRYCRSEQKNVRRISEINLEQVTTSWNMLEHVLTSLTACERVGVRVGLGVGLGVGVGVGLGVRVRRRVGLGVRVRSRTRREVGARVSS